MTDRRATSNSVEEAARLVGFLQGTCAQAIRRLKRGADPQGIAEDLEFALEVVAEDISNA